MSTGELLGIENLRIGFRSHRRQVQAVRGVDLCLQRGEALGIVGESGCGKSTLALALLRLHDARIAQVEGTIRFDGIDVVRLPPRQLQAVRGRRIAMIFQDPMTSLNPYLRIGRQVEEQIRCHLGLDCEAARRRALEMLAAVGIPDPAARYDHFPHEFSGGMRQRVMIAMALSCDPDLLLADEPTTALDVTVQAQILALIRDHQKRRHMGLLLITHDLGVVAGVCDRVAVMYAGQIVEEAAVEDLFARPCHPYTRSLLRALPRVDQPQTELAAIPGQPPNLAHPPVGCSFAARCSHAEAACRAAEPPLREDRAGRRHRCIRELPATAPEGRS